MPGLGHDPPHRRDRAASLGRRRDRHRQRLQPARRPSVRRPRSPAARRPWAIRWSSDSTARRCWRRAVGTSGRSSPRTPSCSAPPGSRASSSPTCRHELRTPLNAIIGFSDLMLTDGVGTLDPQQRDFLEAVLRNGRHLLELINSVLDLSKIEAGRMSLTLGLTDLRDAITGAVTDTASLRSAKSQECVLDLDDSTLDGGGRRRPRASGPVQPPVQRLQVHRRRVAGSSLSALRTRAPLPTAGRPRRRRADADHTGCGLGLGGRYRHRHRAGRHGQAVPGVQPGGQLAEPAGTGHRVSGSRSARSSWRCTAARSAPSRSRGGARPSGSSCRPRGRSAARPVRTSSLRGYNQGMSPQARRPLSSQRLPGCRHHVAGPRCAAVPLGRRVGQCSPPRGACRGVRQPSRALHAGADRYRRRCRVGAEPRASHRPARAGASRAASPRSFDRRPARHPPAAQSTSSACRLTSGSQFGKCPSTAADRRGDQLRTGGSNASLCLGQRARAGGVPSAEPPRPRHRPLCPAS